MISLFKLLKALNSAQAEYQLSIALVFGMFSGFLPFFSIINLFILLAIFFINVPLGIYGLFIVIFNILGSVLDPIFAQIGSALLLNDQLNTLWTLMYNYTPALWTSFNHTTTLGSLIVSMACSVPAYYISKILFKKYRITLEKLSKKHKLLSFLNPYTDKKIQKKYGFIRWWGGSLFISIILFFVVLFILLVDPIIKYSTQFILSKATNTNVNIGSVNTNLTKGMLFIKDITIVKHNKKNTIDEVLIKLNNKNLLRKKIDIELINIKDINIIRKQLSQKNTQEHEEQIKKNDIFSKFDIKLPKINDLLKVENLNSLNEAQMIKDRFDNINTKWQNIYEKNIENFNIDDIKKSYETIKKQSKNIKNINDLVKNIKDLQTAINTKKVTIELLKSQYDDDKDILSLDLQKIKKLPEQDYNKLLSKYSIDQNGALSFVSTYLNEDIEKYIRMLKTYYNKIEPYMPDKEEKRVFRLRGKYIKFMEQNPYPNFVIRNINFNVIGNNTIYDGKINNISNEPNMLKKYLTGEIIGKSNLFDSFVIDIIHKDFITINTTLKGFKKNHIKLDNKLSLLNNKINFFINTQIKNYYDFNSNAKATFLKSNLSYNGGISKSEIIISNILNKIKSFSVTGNVHANFKNINGMKIHMSSDIDEKIKNGFKQELNSQVSSYKQELKLKLNEKIKSKLGDMNYTQFESIDKILKNKTKALSNIKEFLNNKYNIHTLKKKLKNKIEEKAKNKLKDKLKNYFKQ